MSDHTTTGELDLDAILSSLAEAEEAPDPLLWLAGIAREKVPALVAEVQRLREDRDHYRTAHARTVVKMGEWIERAEAAEAKAVQA